MTALTRTLFVGSSVATALFGGASVAAASESPAPTQHFLGSRAAHLSAAGLPARGVKDLLKEIEAVAGADHRAATEGRVDRLEKALKPMFEAMPKDSQNTIDAASVRFLLHRVFVQRHGWFVNGLDNGGGTWGSASPADVFKGHANEHHELFSTNLAHGFSLHQVAVFAATLETLVHRESLERLEAAFRVLGLVKNEELSDEESQEAITAYMLMYVQGANLTAVTPRKYDEMKSLATEAYPTWPDTVDFVQGVRLRILEDTTDEERHTWRTSLKVVEEVAERYGRWQDKECHVLKNMLVGMEQPGTGRVRLQDFYGDTLSNNSWQFVESVPYLRQLGALDDSNPEQLSVIIPNYLNSPANCVASSKFYSVCCIDECDGLLGHLENEIAAPDATPGRIIEIVSALSSDTVRAPRKLSASLSARLEQIASHHGGRVPLHGRLFAQWLHHVYPRECPYPHLAGMTNPLTQEEWLEHTDEPIMAGEDEIRALLSQSKDKAASGEKEEALELPWLHQEELFVNSPSLPKTTSSSTGGTLMVLVTGLLAVVAVGLRAYSGEDVPLKKVNKDCVADRSNHKYYV